MPCDVIGHIHTDLLTNSLICSPLHGISYESPNISIATQNNGPKCGNNVALSIPPKQRSPTEYGQMARHCFCHTYSGRQYANGGRMDKQDDSIIVLYSSVGYIELSDQFLFITSLQVKLGRV